MLYLVWKNPNSLKRFKVGRLWKKSNRFYFEFVNKIKPIIKERIIPFLGPFNKADKLYTSRKMFNIFLSRLPVELRNDKPFESIRKTGARLPTDNLEFIPKKQLEKEMISLNIEINKLNHFRKNFKGLCESEPINLKIDNDNKYSNNCIEIVNKDDNKIGFIPQPYNYYIDLPIKETDYKVKIGRIEDSKLIINFKGKTLKRIKSIIKSSKD